MKRRVKSNFDDLVSRLREPRTTIVVIRTYSRRRSFVHYRIMDTDVETVAPGKRTFPENVARRLSGAWDRLVSYMFEPENGECLAVLRMMFGESVIYYYDNNRCSDLFFNTQH